MEWIVGLTLRALIGLLALLPLATARALGRGIGWLAWKLETEATRVTRINVSLCFAELSETDREQLVRSSVQQTAQLLTEAGALFHWSEARLHNLVRCVQGSTLIESARQHGRGVLILVPHMGNWEYLAFHLGQFGIVALYDPPKLKALDHALQSARSRGGATLVPIDRNGLRDVYKQLASGGVVGLLPDQVPDRNAGTYVGFFGYPALTMNLAHRLIQRTRPVVVLAAALRRDAGFELVFRDPGLAIQSDDPTVALAAMNAAVERLVREAPAQYQWEYKRFKRPPPGYADPYAQRPDLREPGSRGKADRS